MSDVCALPWRLSQMIFALCVAIVPLAAPTQAAEDVVYLRAERGEPASVVRGEIVDFNEKELLLRSETAAPRRLDARRVERIEIDQTDEGRTADEQFARGAFADAARTYRAADSKESRDWLRRRYAAQVVRCYREVGDFSSAARLFVGLMAQDRALRDFEAIPLVWTTFEPNPQLRALATEWLESDDSVSRLLSASYLLSIDRAEALRVLDGLTRDADVRIASMAKAQSWRALGGEATLEQVTAWEADIRAFPIELRAGAYQQLARALLRHKAFDRAAIAALRVPLLAPQGSLVAADAVRSAAVAMEGLENRQAAMELWRELATHYPDTPMAAEARGRLDAERRNTSWTAPESLYGQRWPDDRHFDAAYLDRLRARRLHALAESYCTRRLAEKLDADERLALSIELSQTCVEHALSAPPGDQPELWQRAGAAVDEVIEDEPKHPRLLLARVQQGLVALAHGEWLQREFEITADARQLEQAIVALRAARDTLDAALVESAETLRKAHERATNDWTADELIALRRNVGLQLARALRIQAQAYPDASADRTNAAGRAVDALEPLLTATPRDAIDWNAWLEGARAARLLEDYSAARTRLETIEANNAPDEMQLQARAERIRLALAMGDVSTAQALATGQQPEVGSPELDDAVLDAHLAAWRSAIESGNTQAANTAKALSETLADEISQKWGPYWARRSAMRIAWNVARSANDHAPDVLTGAAATFYRYGLPDEALELYDKAAGRDPANGDSSSAFGAAFTAAAIEQQRGNHTAAAERFRRVATQAPDEPRASQAHLLAIFNRMQSNAGEAGDASTTEKWLEEHLDRWPNDATSAQAAMWLGDLRRRAGRFEQAVDAYRRVDRRDEKAAAAMAAIVASHEAWLEELADASKPTTHAIESAKSIYNETINSPSGLVARPEVRHTAQVALARMLAVYEGKFAGAERLLVPIVDVARPPVDAELPAYEAYVVAAAGVGRMDDARTLLEQFDSQRFMSTIGMLQRAMQTATLDARENIAEVIVDATGGAGLSREGLNERQRGLLNEWRAVALATVGKGDEARRLLEELAKNDPRNGRVQEALAAALTAGADEETWRKAVSQWIVVERHSRPGGDRWLRARLGRAEAYEKLGEHARAVRVVRQTAFTHPDLGGEELKKRFLEVLERNDNP